MEAALAGLIAVAGTLLGSLVTHIFQQRAAKRSQQFAVSARLREERVAAYSEFAGAVLNFRFAEYTRALEGFEDAGSTAYQEATDRSYTLRAVAWGSLYRVRLLTDDPDVSRLAENAITAIGSMSQAEDKLDLIRNGFEVKEALEAFISAASPEVKAPQARGIESAST
jgi:hypothetical protein